MAFLGCTSLKSVKLSTGVAKIEKNAFGSCSALQEIQVAKDNTNFSSLNGVLYSKKQDTLVIYPAAKTDTAYIIPSSVTSVAMYAFSENTYLEALTIPNSLIKVGNSTFFNCKNPRAVSYNGTEEEWNQITIGLLNEKLTGATIQYQERIKINFSTQNRFQHFPFTSVCLHLFIKIVRSNDSPFLSFFGASSTLTLLDLSLFCPQAAYNPAK